MKRKVCVITGSRAEYGLLRWLMREIQAHQSLALQIIATGTHLSPAFGLTFRCIEDDGFNIDAKVEMLLSSDSSSGIAKSMGLGSIGFSDAFEKLKPDIAILLGDRFEIFSAAQAALVARIPLAHIHGGETTEGAIDEAFRHSITKMSLLHFTATQQYRQRVIQLGEDPSRVFNVGALASDGLRALKLLDRASLEKTLGFTLGEKNLLVTFHPATLDGDTSGKQTEELLAALACFREIHCVFTMPNADPGNGIIRTLIETFASERPGKAIVHETLGQLRYFSLMRLVDGVIGNSSSGIIEAPSFHVGTINVGDRQAGRIKASSVIDCAPERESIKNAINRLYSRDFRLTLSQTINPYDIGPVSKKITDILATFPLQGVLKKRFFDLPEQTLSKTGS